MDSERDYAAFQAAVEAAASEHLGIMPTQWVMPMVGLDREGDLVEDVTVPDGQLSVNTVGMLRWAQVAIERGAWG
ncbi:hypothetical protein [Mycetocola saprophilus]|uniref:hypothetical protein n=1 Tax=Mycetocola saprophilus TaxID=76636 RepID=UPI003BF21CF9